MGTIAVRVFSVLVYMFGFTASAQTTPAPQVVNLKTADDTVLKATYFAASKPGPGVLLIHQSNRNRRSWDSVAGQLAAAGINTLTLDMRGLGESGGDKHASASTRSDDVDVAMNFLASQPGVNHDVIGAGGAGWLGVMHSVEAAQRHRVEVKSLLLISGETERDGMDFLRHASQLPELFVFSDDDEYPPTQDAMKLLYLTASSPSRMLVHYSSAEDAPWLWYETSDASRVPAHGAHGTDLFSSHPELPGIIVRWFVTTLVKAPGHAPADALAAAPILNQLQNPDGLAQVMEHLMVARAKDPQAQLWPEAAVDLIGEHYQRGGDVKSAIETFKINLMAYPDSADAHSNLADAYLADGQKNLARQYAEKALTLLDSHQAPASSWSDTEQRRSEIRKGILRILKESQTPATSRQDASTRRPDVFFRDCPDCPEMVVIPGGHFVMGSPDREKEWAATHGGSPGAVSDEAPQHEVTVRAFAIGRYDVTRGEYAAFVRATHRPSGDGCGQGRAIFKWEKDPKLSWEHPGYAQTARDPVVCVSWNDAQAYIAWLNTKSGHGGGYHLPSESEWEYAARAGTTTKFWWGDDDAVAPVHAWFNANSGCQNIKGLFCEHGKTHSVGTKLPNAFGLYDMSGNVWQWTQDCYDNSYTGVPADGRANEASSSDPKANDSRGKCLRVDRGGSWMFPGWLLRPATRERNPDDFRDVIMGFRVAKTQR